MKIYFVVKEPSERTINHFVSSLGNALVAQGCEVVYGLERLWTDEVMDCDIVHFHWPEGIFGLFSHHVTDEELSRMEYRLTWLKDNGKKIFCTCHNLKPHVNKDLGVVQLYDVLFSYADTIVHLGRYSCNLLQLEHPNARHVVVPHHIYDKELSFSISQQEARWRLMNQRKLTISWTQELPDGGKIVLCFGKFRNNQERNFVLTLRKHFDSSVLFLMPGFYRKTLHTWNLKKLVRRLYRTIKYRLAGILFSNEVISDDLMQCYFCAADVVLIPRLDILNSGNLPMAFAAGKVVVGPDVGNVGEILRETDNYVFTPTNINSAVQAVMDALKTSSNKGKQNKVYAIKHWTSDYIASKLLNLYTDK